MKTGLKSYIRQNIPSHWEYVLKENKCINKFINAMYDSLPDNKKGCKMNCGVRAWKLGRELIRYRLTYSSILFCLSSKYQNDFWIRIDNEVKQHEYNNK